MNHADRQLSPEMIPAKQAAVRRRSGFRAPGVEEALEVVSF